MNRETIDAVLAGEACPVAMRRDGQPTLCGRASDPASSLGLCCRHRERAARDLPWAAQRQLDRLEQAMEDRREIEESEMRDAIVYYLQRADGLVKIGFSRRWTTRLATLTNEHGSLVLLAAHTGGRPAERHWHHHFRKDRVEGEWFRLSSDLAAHVEAVGIPVGLPTRPLRTRAAA